MRGELRNQVVRIRRVYGPQLPPFRRQHAQVRKVTNAVLHRHRPRRVGRRTVGQVDLHQHERRQQRFHTGVGELVLELVAAASPRRAELQQDLASRSARFAERRVQVRLPGGCAHGASVSPSADSGTAPAAIGSDCAADREKGATSACPPARLPLVRAAQPLHGLIHGPSRAPRRAKSSPKRTVRAVGRKTSRQVLERSLPDAYTSRGSVRRSRAASTESVSGRASFACPVRGELAVKCPRPATRASRAIRCGRTR